MTSFDALTREPPYKEARPVDRAVAEIRREAGSQLDPAVVAAFEEDDTASLVADVTVDDAVDDGARPVLSGDRG